MIVSKAVLSGFLLLSPVISNGKILNIHKKPSIKAHKKTIKPDIWSDKPTAGRSAITPSLSKRLKLGKKGLTTSGITSEFTVGKNDVNHFVDEEIHDNRHLQSDFEKPEEVYERVKRVKTEHDEISNKQTSNSNKGEKVINIMKDLLKKKLSDKTDIKDGNSKTTDDDSESFEPKLFEKPKQYYEEDKVKENGYDSVENSDDWPIQPEVEDQENISEPNLKRGFRTRFLSEKNEQKRLSRPQNYIKETELGTSKRFGKKRNAENVPENDRDNKKISVDSGVGQLSGHKSGKIKEAILKNVENVKKRLDDKANSFEGFLKGRIEKNNGGVKQGSKEIMGSEHNVTNNEADESYEEEQSYKGKMESK